MGDEDWDTEISGQNFSRGGGGGGGGGGDSGRAGFGAAPTFQPTFPKPGGLSGRVTESSASFGQNVKPQVISGKSNGEVKRGGFGNGRPFGSRAPSGSSFGERRSSNFDREVADTEDSYSDRGVSRRSGFQSMTDESNACRGGGVFGRSGRGNFGSFTNEENEKGAGRWNSGGFGFKRGGFGSPAGDLENKGKGFQGRGGYKGSNEEIIGGSGRSTWKSDGDTEKGDCAGPKVTYVPPPPPDDEGAIFARYQTGINFDKYDKILVDVSGDNPPPAILTFEDAPLCQTLTKNIDKAGYLKLTPVQKYSIPIILAGRDLMACAQTGSGKTAAFLIPILAHMMRDGITATQFKEQQEPECIIVAPTRELINQIFMETRKFLYGTCIRPVVIYGGIQVGYTIRQISQGCNILCATPGRLLDILNRGKIGLSKLKYLVLDEADRMLDMGFMPDIKTLISSPGMPPKEQRQTLMFSATFPQEIQRLAAEFLKTDYLFVVVGQVGGACSDVQQSILQVKQYDKREKLIEILRDIGNERTMVFVETKKKTDFIATTLCQEHMPATSIHGDREQREREEALCYFRLGKCPVLVATSVAARGLDIENVQHVINFDLPSTIDEYVHRIGRTGRCGNIGKAISFFDPHTDSALAQPLIKVLADAQQEVPAWLEEMACSAGGISFISSGGSTFASTDSRKAFHGKDNQHSGGFAASNISEVGESWD